MKTGRYAAVVLAAGYSGRMERFKPLLPLGEETVADHLMSAFLQNGVDVYLVVGHRRDELRAGIRTRNIQFVENPDYPQGMFSSVRAGLRPLGDGYLAAFIAPVDVPLVRPATIARLLQAAEEHPGRVIHPVFRMRRGHPPLVPAALFSAVLDWRGGGGLKSVLHAHEDLAVEVDVPDGNILVDIDNPADYARVMERFRRREASPGK